MLFKIEILHLTHVRAPSFNRLSYVWIPEKTNQAAQDSIKDTLVVF